MATAGQSHENYFSSYGDLSVHELMLKDRPRTLAYRKFFESNCDLVKDKIVMDVGAGTGILSLFAASAGAKKVLAVEASSVASLCQEIVEENKLEHIIEVLHGTVETISLPPGIQHVDVIISEWMGFYLLHESMLDSVIVARDRFLAPDGILAPSHASLVFAPVDMSHHFQERAEEWSNIYGFDFSPLASEMNVEEISKPLITTLHPSVLQAEPQKVLDIDLRTVNTEDVRRISRVLKFPMEHDSKVFGFAVWFDVEFNAGSNPAFKNIDPISCVSLEVNEKGDACSFESPQVSLENSSSTIRDSIIGGTSDQEVSGESLGVLLKTGPHDPPTHWKQTVIFLPRTILVESGINLCCRVTMEQDDFNKRHYNITITLLDDHDMNGDDDDDEESDISVSGDSLNHPVPCRCGSDRCQLIAALVDKYGDEHKELGDEAKMVEIQAGVEAARQLDADIERDGWLVDSSISGVSVDESVDDAGETV